MSSIMRPCGGEEDRSQSWENLLSEGLGFEDPRSQEADIAILLDCRVGGFVQSVRCCIHDTGLFEVRLSIDGKPFRIQLPLDTFGPVAPSPIFVSSDRV
jgi:hypothetical protein